MTMSPASQNKRIVIDWGTTSFRATLLGADGTPFESIETERGIRVIRSGTHAEELIAHIGAWLDAHAPLPVYALGMITSRNGWVEVPYVACPASLADLAAGVVHKNLANGLTVSFFPGIEDRSRFPFPDVMRGEETQMAGYGLDRDATIVLPGTHSKWARIADGRIAAFQTFVTGELFRLLVEYSFIAKIETVEVGENVAAFDRGVKEALGGTAANASLPTLLFSVRSGMLAGKLDSSQVRDYLSGLLIGHEFLCGLTCGWSKPGGHIVIVGNDKLQGRYARAARLAGLTVEEGGTDAALRGALAIAKQLEGG